MKLFLRTYRIDIERSREGEDPSSHTVTQNCGSATDTVKSLPKGQSTVMGDASPPTGGSA
jgi:hypothetical protein